jgi:excisionase family DNA binding protein
VAKVLRLWATVSAAEMNDQGLLTASQAAEALSATSQTIRNWIRSERLHAVRIGNRFLIPWSEVERLRGELPGASRGESPWEFAEDGPVVPLPRTADSRSESDPTEGLLGA